MWRIKSPTGWTARANSAQEARKIALQHSRDWADMGRDVEVEYFYNAPGFGIHRVRAMEEDTP